MSRRILPLLALCIIFGASHASFAGSKSSSDARSPRFEERVKVVGRAYYRVGLTVTVTDRSGRPVRGLVRDDFRLLEDGVEVAIQDFGVEGDKADRPLSVAVLLDFSESMGGQIQKVREAAKALLVALRSSDEIMVAKFNQDRTVLQPFTHDPGDPEVTLSEIGRAEGGTALFRSVEQTLKDLRLRPGRKVILVVTDGLDNGVRGGGAIFQSLYLQDLLQLCLRTQTVVYGIRPGMVQGRPPFERFVEETGGRLLYTSGDLERLFKQLGEEFLSQYYLAYDIDPSVKQGKRRSLRVDVARADLVVKTMGGFTTPRTQLETLLRDIEDEDARLRADAAYDLGFVSEPRASKALRKALHDKDEKVRELAAGALARLDDEEAIPDLVKALGDKKEAVAKAAFEAVRQLGLPAIPDLIEETSEGTGALGSRPQTPSAARLLGVMGDDRALEPLAQLLRRGDSIGRVAAAEALGYLGLSQGIPAVKDALKDPEASVRGAALRSLASLSGKEARPFIEEFLRGEPDAALRELARTLLSSI
jgi:VWFA-related protein